MIHHIKESFTYNRTQIPVGLQVLLQVVTFAATAIATVYLAPGINEHFESQKRRSEFYVKAIEALSDETKDIIGNLAIINRPEIDKDERKSALISLKKDIAKLHWRSVEFALIFDDRKAADDIKAYQEALQKIDGLVTLDQKGMNAEDAKNSVEEFGVSSAKLMHRLAREADVNVLR